MSGARVLVVSSKYPPEYSGSGNRAHQTYRRLSAKFGITFEVLCGSVTENDSRTYEIDGVRVHRFAGKVLPRESRQAWEERGWRDRIALRMNYFSEALPVFRFLAQHRNDFDVIHVFGNNAVTSAAVIHANRRRSPLVVEITYDAPPRPYRPRAVRLLDPSPAGFHPGARFVCISRRLEQHCRRHGITQPVWTRPNPVDLERFRPRPDQRAALRLRLTGLAPDDVVVLQVAKFMPLKNQLFMVDVLRRLPPEYKLVLAGPVADDGPNRDRDRGYLDKVRAAVRSARLEDRVVLHEGFVDRPEDWMAMADVGVLPSRVEGLGTPMLEFLCCGVPVVAHRMPGVTDEWIEEGVDGFTAWLDADAFAHAVAACRRLDRGRMEPALRRVRSAVDEERIDAAYHELILRCAGRAAAGAGGRG